jgi:hypothetical protein
MTSQALTDALIASGWSPDRSISIAYWMDQLRSYGLTILPEAESVLRTFGGLVVNPVRSPSDKYAPGVIRFDPLLACEPDRIQWWERYLQMKLTPLGEVGDQACLVLAENGTVFSIWDGILFKDGNSFTEALENTLVFGNEAPIKYADQSENDEKDR